MPVPATVLALLLLASLLARPAAAQQYTPLGCFADQNKRAMTSLFSSSSMTIELCAQKASSLGYAICGLQVGLDG